MKYLLLIIFCSSFVGLAQDVDSKIKKGNALYSELLYNEAIKKYEMAKLATQDQKRNLARSYWKTDQGDKAEKLFNEIVTTEGYIASDLYEYASILRENEKYEASDEWMKKFAEMDLNDTRGKEYLRKQGAYKELRKDKMQFILEELPLNSTAQDFGATYYKDKVVFSSSRQGTKPVFRRWNRNNLPYLDLYIADVVENDLQRLETFDKKINHKYHEGPVSFNKEGDWMIFTQNNYLDNSEDEVMRVKLLSSKFKYGKWQEPTELPFNSPDYSCGHASICSKGKWVFFASDMPGGHGGVDIYKVPIKDDGSLGMPVNLGPKVNSEGDEMFPYFHPDNEMLFFSSNGKVGLGGLDVFVVEMKEGKFPGKVLNVGAPINSSRDDFSFVLNADGINGYMASNRSGGEGSDDIYSFEMFRPFTFGKLIQGQAKDKEGMILADVNVRIYNELDELIDAVFTDENGEFEFEAKPDIEYLITGNKPKFFESKINVMTNEDDDVYQASVVLEKDPGLSIITLVTDKDAGTAIPEVKIQLTDNMTGVAEVAFTDENGSYRKPLNEKKLNDRGSYNITLSKEGYASKTITYNVGFDKEGKYNIADKHDLTLEKLEIGKDLSKIIDLNPIYFDLGRYKIRPDAATELDKIVTVLNENPKMEIELGSHTDSRGSARSNEALSDKRAKASADYVKERISNPNRISGKGYGENKLVNDCEDGVKCNEEEHQDNRRTEFIILKM